MIVIKVKTFAVWKKQQRLLPDLEGLNAWNRMQNLRCLKKNSIGYFQTFEVFKTSKVFRMGSKSLNLRCLKKNSKGYSKTSKVYMIVIKV
jgi:hypothetical protein